MIIVIVIEERETEGHVKRIRERREEKESCEGSEMRREIEKEKKRKMQICN